MCSSLLRAAWIERLRVEARIPRRHRPSLCTTAHFLWIQNWNRLHRSCRNDLSPEKMARAQEQTRADHSRAGCARRRPRTNRLECEAECKVDAGKRCVAQVIHTVYVDNVNVLRVEPVAWPRVDESERIASVLETAIAVVALANAKRVFPSKIGLETVCGNAATTVTTCALRLLYRLDLLLLCISSRPAWCSCLAAARSFRLALRLVVFFHRACFSVLPAGRAALEQILKLRLRGSKTELLWSLVQLVSCVLPPCVVSSTCACPTASLGIGLFVIWVIVGLWIRVDKFLAPFRETVKI